MKITVDHRSCIATGGCRDVCPEVFELRDDALHVLDDSPPEELHELVRDAADMCPTGAIHLDTAE